MKLWGGRFSKNTAKEVDDFNSSIRFDQRLYKQDIRGSVAHARMLGKTGIISDGDAEAIISGLMQIKKDIEAGTVQFSEAAEDIHMNIESILTERIGDAGKRLHTGRSRNDQVALDMRLYVCDEIDEIKELLERLIHTILDVSEKHIETIMPGYTHLQKAQPITFAHHFMAYCEMFKRDMSRLSDCKKRMNVSPLGSGALAGTTYPLDREMVAKELLLDGVTRNSLDGVSDRDFVIELLSCISMIMMHLSRFSEEIILWQSDEFSFINLDDSYSTGSSIMPQKKNPDIAELVRGKTGRVYGDLLALLTVMKGLPLAYNKDMQEDKESLFDAVDTVKMCLPVFADMLATMTVHKDRMLQGAKGGFTNATDIADYLTKKGLPFRNAHEIVGKMVLYATNEGKSLDELTLAEYKNCSDVFEDDIYDAISMTACVNGRTVAGGPAFSVVKQAIEEARKG